MQVSSRTLKRILESEHTTYSSLNSHCLLHKAFAKLSEKSLSIEEVGDSLGYSDSPNFIRFFKSRTGMTPAVYRESYSETQLRLVG